MTIAFELRNQISLSRVSVLVPSIERVEENGVVFYKLDYESGTTKKLEHELCIRDFLNLDTENEKEMLDFQRAHGVLSNPFREISGNDRNTIGKPNAINSDNAKWRTSAGMIGIGSKYLEKANAIPSPFVVSGYEAVMAAKYLKDLFKPLLKAKRSLEEYYNDKSKRHITLGILNDFNIAIAQVFPYVDFVNTDDEITMPLSHALICQFLTILTDEEGIKECKYSKCSNLLQYKSGEVDPSTGQIIQKKRGASYCSPECQRAQNKHGRNKTTGKKY